MATQALQFICLIAVPAFEPAPIARHAGNVPRLGEHFSAAG